MSDFMDKLREQIVEEEVDPRPVMEQALVAAIAALKEIQYCAAVGSSNLCKIEADDVLAKIEALNVEFTPMPEEPEFSPAPNIVIIEK